LAQTDGEGAEDHRLTHTALVSRDFSEAGLEGVKFGIQSAA